MIAFYTILHIHIAVQFMKPFSDLRNKLYVLFDFLFT